MDSVNHNVIADKPIYNFFKKVLSLIYSSSFFFYSSQDELEHWR